MINLSWGFSCPVGGGWKLVHSVKNSLFYCYLKKILKQQFNCDVLVIQVFYLIVIWFFLFCLRLLPTMHLLCLWPRDHQHLELLAGVLVLKVSLLSWLAFGGQELGQEA
jgi:hypothetical protein